MKYETVTLEEKTLVGFCARTNNASPEMSSVIGGLWQKLYAPENFANVTGRVNEKAIGLYTDYSSDEKGEGKLCLAGNLCVEQTRARGGEV